MKKLLYSLCLAASSVLMAELAIVQNGTPVAEIIRPDDAQPPVVYAAEELRDHIKLITGADLAITAKPSGKNAIVLAVGDKQFEGDLKAIGTTDGYAVRQKDNCVYVVGAIPKGVLNGVYKLLFKNTDIIWARPNEEFGTIYTETKDLVLTQTDWVDVPKFILRGWQFPSPRAGGLPSDIWQFRQGSNWSASHMATAPNSEKYGTIKEYGGGHNLCGIYINEGKYYATHPEFYSLVKGKRSRHSELRGGTQLCFTNAEMTKCFIQEVDARCKANPGYDTYRIMIEDNYHLCECDECTKRITLPDGTVIDKTHKAFRSTQFFLWLNPIAKHIWDNYHKRVLSFAYFFTEIPPLCPVEPNIDISLCPIYKNSRYNVLHPDNALTFAKADGWLKITPNVTWREYYGLCAAFPRPIDAVAIDDYRYVNSRGVVRTYSEMCGDCGDTAFTGRYSWDVNSMYFWVIANAIWNPEPDVKDFRKTFLTRVYKQAADDIAEFYSIIEKDFLEAHGKSGWTDNPFGHYRNTIIAKHHVSDCQKALANAMSKGLTGKSKKMLEHLYATFTAALDETDIRNAYSFFRCPKPLTQTAEAFAGKEWRCSHLLKEFVDEKDAPATAQSHARLFYDDTNIYVGLRAFAENTDQLDFNRDAKASFNAAGESFSLVLQSMKDYSAVCTFAFDPAGHRAPAKGKWTVKTELLKDGWFAFATIPWTLFRDPKLSGIRVAITRNNKLLNAPAQASHIGTRRAPVRLFSEKTARQFLHFGAPSAEPPQYTPEAFAAPAGERNNVTYTSFRWCSEVLFWGDKNEKASFKLYYDKVNNSEEASRTNTDHLVMTCPDGSAMELGDFVFNGTLTKGKDMKEFSFVFPQTGLYRLPLDPGFNGYTFIPCQTLRWSMRGADKQSNSMLVRPSYKPVTGCFQVPKGVKQFILDIGGGAGANTDPAIVTFKDSQGKVVREVTLFENMQTIVFARSTTEDETWTFKAETPRYGFHIRLPRPLSNVWANSPGNLPRTK